MLIVTLMLISYYILSSLNHLLWEGFLLSPDTLVLLKPFSTLSYWISSFFFDKLPLFVLFILKSFIK